MKRATIPLILLQIKNTIKLQEDSRETELLITTISEDHEETCWGCGLRLLLSSNAPIFKCGWCGAITKQNPRKRESKCSWWRRLRDRCFVCILLVFMLFVICGGLWAIYPVIFSISSFCGIFHSIVTMILSIATISSFSLAAFQCAGMPPNIQWGSYPVVQKGELENYTFCHYCSKPKSPRTHHCRSCGICILDMDHHCPFIGNCVGAANHRYFILFLISAVTSTIYVSIMSAYAGLRIWPSLTYSLGHFSGFNMDLALRAMMEIFSAFLRSTVLLSARGLVLVYLFVCSVSVQIGLSVLLWQQLCFIYEGKTYLSHLSTRGNEEIIGRKDCQNLFRFFECPYSISRYLPNFVRSRKRHEPKGS
ncbi:hypothetical protein F2P56_007476 [Juglans regia]|uniref:S-acyltransferase n=1 Tax=Juglans regia TaxID=51240 RepID=A0A834D4P4_JUGRE|nr:hypothetical protein F2P56_007476 [Juglans regia]